ncbi:MAG: MetQ/NlpA family ABC transporter substrate-binding protein [Oscillospiraceae bacterium]|jgi:D-methionine transport system substrate-binding protein
MKKILALVLIIILALSLLAGCGGSKSSDGGAAPSDSAAPETAKPDEGGDAEAPAEPVTIKVGASPTPHAEILAVVKDALAEKGYELEIVEFADYVLPNTALESGELDANYFQHLPYLTTFNAEHGTHLVSVAAIHYEPFGIFPGKTKSIDELKEGATISLPNDGSNETRALLLLQQEGIIKLKEGINASSNATILDIAENPLNINFVEMEAAQLAISLPDVDMAVINGNYAIQAGLNAATDALAVESAEGDAAQTYANIVAVKEGNENNPAILALIEALKSDQVKNFINETFQGAVVPIF